jgi:hypothetical protein
MGSTTRRHRSRSLFPENQKDEVFDECDQRPAEDELRCDNDDAKDNEDQNNEENDAPGFRHTLLTYRPG